MNVFSKILEKDDIIETPRLRIRIAIVHENVFADLFEIYSDAENLKGYAQITFNSIQQFFPFLLEKIDGHQNENHGFIGYLIELEGKFIGVRNLILDGVYTYNGMRQDNNENVISEIVINKRYWNKGYATEASEAIFRHIRRYNIKRVATFINPSNKAAIQLNKRLGFNEVSVDKLLRVDLFHQDVGILCPDLKNSLIFLKNLI